MIPAFDRRCAARDAGRPCALDGVSVAADGSPLHCIFRDGFEPVERNGKVVNARQIRARLVSEDAAGARRGSELVVGAERYLVENVEPDAYGWVFLSLVTGA